METDDRGLANLSSRVGRALLRRGLKLVTAESCTGGFIAKVLTDIAGSSVWFCEALVTYSDEAKTRRLLVPKRLLFNSGAVSEMTVRAMAAGALRRSEADIAVAVTGIAGPGGAVPGKPVGTVWFAWAVRRGKRIHVTVQRKRFRGNRDLVRRRTVRTALQGLLR